MKKQPQKRKLAAVQPKKKETPAVVKTQLRKKEIPAAVKKQPQKRELAAVVKTQPRKEELPADITKQLRKKEISPEDLGTRYKCYKCDTKFYDLGRPQPLCPSCGANQNDDESKAKHKRKKKRHLSPFVRTDHTITAPVESDELIEIVNEVDAEYALDVDDIVLEESEDTDKE